LKRALDLVRRSSDAIFFLAVFLLGCVFDAVSGGLLPHQALGGSASGRCRRIRFLSARGLRIVAYCGWISGGFGFWIRGLFNPLVLKVAATDLVLGACRVICSGTIAVWGFGYGISTDSSGTHFLVAGLLRFICPSFCLQGFEVDEELAVFA